MRGLFLEHLPRKQTKKVSHSGEQQTLQYTHSTKRYYVTWTHFSVGPILHFNKIIKRQISLRENTTKRLF